MAKNHGVVEDLLQRSSQPGVAPEQATALLNQAWQHAATHGLGEVPASRFADLTIEGLSQKEQLLMALSADIC